MRASQKRWGWVRRVVACLALLAVVMGVGVWVATRKTGTEISKELERIRAAGLPAEFEELNEWYERVPDSSNAAVGVLRAIEKFKRSEELGMSLPQGAQSLSPEFANAIADHIENNQETLEILAEALKLNGARYPLTFQGNIQTIPPHLAELKKLANLLRYAAANAATNGEAERTFEALRNGFLLAGTLRNEPLMISELVRIACAAIALHSLEFALHHVSFTEEQLKELDQALQGSEVDCSRSRFRALAGERTLGIRGFDLIRSGQLTQPAPGTTKERASAGLYKMLGIIDRDEREYLAMMEGLIAAMTNGFPSAYQQTEALEKELDRRYSSGLRRLCAHTRGVFPAFAKAVRKEAALLTQIRCARAAITVERYRVAHEGSLPDDLNALVPTFLAEILRDPVKGESLVYFETGTGYQISSPGAAVELDNKRSTMFSVSRPAVRESGN
ncbi:MAG TPA: hypothetical protein VF773_05810 [Verrucomicrobiae bacterium]